MKLSQLSLADYNKLDSIPVINQDLSASGFTPVANTYYRHTGATTATFTQGVIYLYDTAYHKLGESGGGGTTLNKYTATISYQDSQSRALITRILQNAKSANIFDKNYLGAVNFSCQTDGQTACSVFGNYISGVRVLMNMRWNSSGAFSLSPIEYQFIPDETETSKINITKATVNPSYTYQFTITYYNDVEIT